MANEMWLMRTAHLWISGPHSREKMIEMIQAGDLALDDEICAGNGYWIQMSERDEIRKWLGVDPPIPESDEEITATHILTPESLAQAHLSMPAPGHDPSVPFDFEPVDFEPEGTQVFKPRTTPPLPTLAQTQTESRTPTPHILPSQPRQAWVVSAIEKPSAWKVTLWVLIGVAAFILGLILRKTFH